MWTSLKKTWKAGWQGQLPLGKLILPLSDFLLLEGPFVYVFFYVLASLLIASALIANPGQGGLAALFVLVLPPIVLYIWWLKALWSSAQQLQRSGARWVVRTLVLIIPLLSLVCFCLIMLYHLAMAIFRRFL